MEKKKIFAPFMAVLIVLMSFSCSNDNKGFEEYFHPMGNNPVQVVRWLKNVKKSFYGKEARISLYKLDGKEYYTAQVIIGDNNILTSPYTIYEANDEECIVYFHTDDALVTEQDHIYTNFITNAELIKVLWSNESKYSSFEF